MRRMSSSVNWEYSYHLQEKEENPARTGIYSPWTTVVTREMKQFVLCISHLGRRKRATSYASPEPSSFCGKRQVEPITPLTACGGNEGKKAPKYQFSHPGDGAWGTTQHDIQFMEMREEKEKEMTFLQKGAACVFQHFGDQEENTSGSAGIRRLERWNLGRGRKYIQDRGGQDGQ